jgi:hypothetical protein
MNLSVSKNADEFGRRLAGLLLPWVRKVADLDELK